MSAAAIFWLSLYGGASLFLIILGHFPDKTCNVHKWPKRTDKEYERDPKTGQLKQIPHNDPKKAALGMTQRVWTGKFVETAKDEWLRHPHCTTELFRQCRRCGTMEMTVSDPDNGKGFIRVYWGGKEIGQREYGKGESRDTVISGIANILLID